MEPRRVTDEALDRLAAAVDLRIDPADRAGVTVALARLLALGAVVAAAVDDAEPASVFDP